MQDAEKVQAEIQKVLADDPTIADANRIVVSVEKGGFLKGGRQKVILKGSVHSESDHGKIVKVAALHAAGREIVDEITVLH